MANKPFIRIEDEDRNVTRIHVKPKRSTGIKLEHRSGAGYHDTRPKRQRTRQAQRNAYLQGQGE